MLDSKLEDRILVVEDDDALREIIAEEIQQLGYQTFEANSAEEALSLLTEDRRVSLVVSDLKLPEADGLQLLEETQRLPLPPHFIIITAFGSIEQAVDALQQGADNFLTKPLNFNHLRLCVERTLKERRLKSEVEYYRKVVGDGDFHGIIGRSQPMQKLFEQIRIIGKARGPVLILGESGTGKELVARALHEESDRADGPYVTVNCASVPEELIESELFGHTAGSFTGAVAPRRGLIAEADGGSILLDEIGEMPAAMQAKLLRTLQDNKIRAVGADQEIPVNVRVIAATNRDLERDVGEGKFRPDLFYRLETFPIHVPPLRDRDLDIDLLAAHFIVRFGGDEKQIQGLSSEAIECLHQHDFPGNVRELSNALERAVVFTRDSEIQVRDLPPRVRRRGSSPGIKLNDHSLEIPVGRNRVPTLSELDRHYAQQILVLYDGNKSRAAQVLGIGRRTLYRMLESDPTDVSD